MGDSSSSWDDEEQVEGSEVDFVGMLEDKVSERSG